MLPSSNAAKPAPEGCFLPIVYQDADLLVLNKASGTPSLPLHPDETHTAVNAALAHCPDLSQLGSLAKSPLEPGLVHRLDTGTSGLLIFARTAPEYERMRKVFRGTAQVTGVAHRKQGDWGRSPMLRKIYRCLSVSQEERSELPAAQVIAVPLGHDKKSKKKMRRVYNSAQESKIRGTPLPAITYLHRALRVEQAEMQEAQPSLLGLVDLEVEIKTGVMHQIRCHLAGLGYPILGDPIYKSKPGKPSNLDFGPFQKRLWLHAWRLEIPLKDGKVLKLETELPAGWPNCGPPEKDYEGPKQR